MELPAGRVIIELAPGFAPEHVANIKTMAKGGFWDGLTIYRSQDNFVVQFGDPEAGEMCIRDRCRTAHHRYAGPRSPRKTVRGRTCVSVQWAHAARGSP